MKQPKFKFGDKVCLIGRSSAPFTIDVILNSDDSYKYSRDPKYGYYYVHECSLELYTEPIVPQPFTEMEFGMLLNEITTSFIPQFVGQKFITDQVKLLEELKKRGLVK